MPFKDITFKAEIYFFLGNYVKYKSNFRNVFA